MNVVESVYGQTEQGTTVIEGSLFVKGKANYCTNKLWAR